MDEKFNTLAIRSSVSSLWLAPPMDMASRTQYCVDSTRELIASRDTGYIFFRADDVVVPGKSLARLMELFTQYSVPLSLAVIPAWLTKPRWRQLKELGKKAPSLWCWHQHGWRHVNHECQGKKQEFGQSRSPSQIKKDLVKGKRRLEMYMGKDFYPVFTPPWNRCSNVALKIIKELEYHAISRSQGSVPPTPEGLADFQMNVDLHTRKELQPNESLNHLLAELKGSLLSGSCGIMIHHRQMNEAAFSFLNFLLSILVRWRGLNFVHFNDLVQHKEIQ